MKALKNSIKPLFVAILLSAFLYVEYFFTHTPFVMQIVNAIIGFVGLYFLFEVSKKEAFFVGFFVGVLWFWWLGLSFRFTDLWIISFFVPFIVGFVYGLCFYVIFYFENIYLRAFFVVFAFSYVYPLGFGWFNFAVVFASSIFMPTKLTLAIMSAIIVFLHKSTNKYRFLASILLIFCLDLAPHTKKAPLKIFLADPMVKQELKWKLKYKKVHIKKVLDLINKASNDGYDVIVLPESAIMGFLDHEKILLKILMQKSREITIVVGALRHENGKNFNSTFVFDNGSYKFFDKVFLVPFGEEIPLPKFIARFIDDIFFGGAEDFSTAKTPSDFLIKKTKFRSAICYEAGLDEMFEHAPKYMIVISNNAWFYPSIMPTVQKLVMQARARSHNVVIYHSANMFGSGVLNVE